MHAAQWAADFANGAIHHPACSMLAGMETRAAFRLIGQPGLTAAAVTQQLGMQPSEALEAGAPVSSRSSRTRELSLWLLNSGPEIEADSDPAEHLRRLLTVLEPVTGQLWQLVRAGYEANWYCWVASHATEHAVELDRPTLQRLLVLPGDLWLDVSGDDEES
jgi:hypothetical protein